MPNGDSNWLIDSAATHHVISDLANLSLHDVYEVGDGSDLAITHPGSTRVTHKTKEFALSNVLCATSIKKDLISVSKFCQSNKTSFEFFPSFFVVKYFNNTGAPLLQGLNKDEVYAWPQLGSSLINNPCALLGVRTSASTWVLQKVIESMSCLHLCLSPIGTRV